MQDKIKVLMVCHGNICRSPMAEFILKDLVARRGLTDRFEIASAATSTEEIWNGIGNPIYPPAQAELKKHGIGNTPETDFRDKRARQLTKSDYEIYDYLIGMDESNIRGIERITGHRGGKISMLLSFAGEQATISDPWYSGRFDKTYADVTRGCEAFLEYLIEQGEV